MQQRGERESRPQWRSSGVTRGMKLRVHMRIHAKDRRIMRTYIALFLYEVGPPSGALLYFNASRIVCACVFVVFRTINQGVELVN